MLELISRTALIIDAIIAIVVIAFYMRRLSPKNEYTYTKQFDRTQSVRVPLDNFQPEIIDYCIEQEVPIIVNSNGIFIEREKKDD